MKKRTLGRLLGVAALALLLAGCFRVNLDLEISPENTVSGIAVFAVDRDALELSGQNVEQVFDEMDLSDLPEGATVEPYDEDDFVGQQIAFEDVPLDEFQGSQTLGTGDELSIERRGDEFHVSGQLDLSGQDLPEGGQFPQQLLESFEFRISMTFPGEVKSASGEIDGNTVTWEPKFGQDNPIQAVASAVPSESSPLLILLIVASLLVVAGVAFLLLRRSSAPAAAPTSGWAGGPTEEGAPSPSSPAAPVESPPAPAPGTPVPPTTEPTPTPQEAPGSAVPPEDEGPPPVPPVSG
jgi:hypothetical protein